MAPLCHDVNVQKGKKWCFAGGRLSRRFRREGQTASTAQAASRQQWQESGDVSISGSEAGGPLPDDDPSIYTRRSNRFASQLPLCLRHTQVLQTHVPVAWQQNLQVACLVEREGKGDRAVKYGWHMSRLLIICFDVILTLGVKVTAEYLDVSLCTLFCKLPLISTAVCRAALFKICMPCLTHRLSLSQLVKLSALSQLLQEP